MTDYPPPHGVTPMQVIVISFVIATLTILFWKGVWSIIAMTFTAVHS